MNIFRFAGDMCHVASIFILLLRLRATKSAAGISLKTQELFLLVFIARYVDLFTTYYSLYNSLMKILYISTTSMTVWMMRTQDPIKSTYQPEHDSFLHLQFAVLPCAALAFITCLWQGFSLQVLLLDFSFYLEAVAIVPQLIVLQRFREIENLTSHYIATLGAYRGLYILNWIYRFYTEAGYTQGWVKAFAGVVQTGLYVDYFYYYYVAFRDGSKLSLPA
ncbi:unnamed protein product [Chrysoparadoxa australica]